MRNSNHRGQELFIALAVNLVLFIGFFFGWTVGRWSIANDMYSGEFDREAFISENLTQETLDKVKAKRLLEESKRQPEYTGDVFIPADAKTVTVAGYKYEIKPGGYLICVEGPSK